MMFLPPLKKGKKKSTKPQKGFTLIELLVVIGILAVLLAIVLIAVNPPRQFALARNTQRRSDALAILNAVGQYFAEYGALPDGVSTSSANVSNTGADLCTDSRKAIVPTYIAELPMDPETGTGITDCSGGAYDSGYTILKNANNRVTVTAPAAEDPDGGGNPPTIQVTR